MGSADPLCLLFALLVFIVSGVLGAVQWGILLRFHGINPGFAGTVSRYFMGLFFNYILPGFVGGDVVRIYHAKDLRADDTGFFIHSCRQGNRSPCACAFQPRGFYAFAERAGG